MHRSLFEGLLLRHAKDVCVSEAQVFCGFYYNPGSINAYIRRKFSRHLRLLFRLLLCAFCLFELHIKNRIQDKNTHSLTFTHTKEKK